MAKDNTKTLLIVIGLISLAASFAFGGGFAASMTVWLAVNVLLAVSFRFVQLIGELNFAVAAFAGIGAYAAGIATTLLGWNIVVAFLLAAVSAGVISALVGFITLRAKGPYFLLVSFAFTEVVRMIYTQVEVIGGNSGMIGIFPPDALYPYYPTFAVAVAAILTYVLYHMEKSDLGKVFVAIRNNDAVVETVGIGVHAKKVLCLTIASVAAGIAGALLAFSNSVISPGDFSFILAVYVLAYVKVGGESNVLGAVAGALLMTFIAQFSLSFGALEHIFFGAAIVLAVLLMPDGLYGLVTRLFGSRKPKAAAQHH